MRILITRFMKIGKSSILVVRSPKDILLNYFPSRRHTDSVSNAMQWLMVGSELELLYVTNKIGKI